MDWNEFFKVATPIITFIFSVIGSGFIASVVTAKVNKTIADENVKTNTLIANETIKTNRQIAKQTLQDSLDSKSKWREKLFEAVSKEKIELEQVHILRTTLRYKEKENTDDLYDLIVSTENLEEEKCTFDNMTITIINFCKQIIEKGDIGLHEEQQVRIYGRYLLKHQWEWLNFANDDKETEDEIKKKEVDWIRDTMTMIRENNKES